MHTICSLFNPKQFLPVSRSQQLLLKWFFIGCLILTAFFVFALLIRDASLNKSTAYTEVQDFVAERLIRPTSAKFPERSAQGVIVEYLGRHRYSVSGYVHSLNTFGNLQRSGYKCIIRYIGAGEWVCENITFD